jgi:uncharacterized protein YxeA
MKKIFTLLVALVTITTLFAQSGRYDQRSDNGYGSYQNKQYNHSAQGYDNNNYSQDDHQKSYGYNDRSYNNRSYNDRTYNDRNENSDKNRDYNRNTRIYNERNYRSSNAYGRSGYDSRNEKRSGTLNAVGAGLIVGGIIALIAGSH